MSLLFSKVFGATLLLAIVVVMGAGCGDPLLDHSRLGCTPEPNIQAFGALEYTSREGIAQSGADAASAISFDCMTGSVASVVPFPGCGQEYGDVIRGIPNGRREFTEALAACVEVCVADVTKAIAGRSLTPKCTACFGSFASCSAVFCTPECVGGLSSGSCVQCNDDAGCAQNLSACSGIR